MGAQHHLRRARAVRRRHAPRAPHALPPLTAASTHPLLCSSASSLRWNETKPWCGRPDARRCTGARTHTAAA
eukprot:525831-Pleurochrysis_carterae.AAC.1